MRRSFRGLLILPALASLGGAEPLPNPKDEQAICAIADVLFHNYRYTPDVFYYFNNLFKVCPHLADLPPSGINVGSDEQVDDINKGKKEGAVISYSLPTFDRTKTKAHLEEFYSCGPLCGGPRTIYFEKHKTGWQIVKTTHYGLS